MVDDSLGWTNDRIRAGRACPGRGRPE